MKSSRFLFMFSLVQFALLIPLALWVRSHKTPLREVILTRFFQRNQKSWKRKAITVLNTFTGSSVFLNILVVPIVAILWRMRLRAESLSVLSSCWLGALVRTMLKQAVHRPRPNKELVHVTAQSQGKSFPSGHTASSICLWGWICALAFLYREKIRPSLRALFIIPALFAVITGPARVYLGDHWPTDVLGGYLFGSGWLTLSLGIYMQVRERITTNTMRFTNKN